jgi:predicted  nucleic acid-binding Zn-ribbon protein
MVKETIEQLAKLQALDTRIHYVDEMLMRIPSLLKASKDAYETLEAEQFEAENEHVTLKVAFSQEETLVAQHRELLNNAQKKLTSVQNNKEYEAALKELDSLKKSIADSDIKISEMKKSLEALDNLIAEKSTAAAEKKAAYEAEKTEKEAENKELFVEAEELKAQREAFAATIRKSYLSKYEKVRSARGNRGIVPISGETCTGCYMKIPPQMAVEVKKERELLQCPHCQRFLYQDKSEADAEETTTHAEA